MSNRKFFAQYMNHKDTIDRHVRNISYGWRAVYPMARVGYELEDVCHHVMLKMRSLDTLSQYDPTKGSSMSTFLYYRVLSIIGHEYKLRKSNFASSCREDVDDRYDLAHHAVEGVFSNHTVELLRSILTDEELRLVRAIAEHGMAGEDLRAYMGGMYPMQIHRLRKSIREKLADVVDLILA